MTKGEIFDAQATLAELRAKLGLAPDADPLAAMDVLLAKAETLPRDQHRAAATKREKNTQLIDDAAIKTLISKAVATGQPQSLWDSELTGFGVKAGATGKASFQIQWWSGGRSGRSQRFVVGRYQQPAKAGMIVDGKPLAIGRKINAALGRALAAAELSRIKAGHNPHEKKQVEKASASFETIMVDYLRTRGTGIRSWAQTKRCVMFEFGSDGAAYNLRKRPLNTLKHDDFVSVRDTLETRSPSICRLYFSCLRKFFAWAREKKLVAVNPSLQITLPPPPDERERTFSDAELVAFWHAVEKLPDPRHIAIYKLLVLTGQRHKEVSEIRWSELNLAAAEWTIPAARAKNKRTHVVDLSAQVLAILQALPRQANTDMVFVSLGRKSIPLAPAKTALEIGLETALGKKPAEWRTHDLRRTFVSGLGEMGFPLHIGEMCVNHLLPGMKRVYMKYTFRPERRAAFKAWGERIDALLRGETPSTNVVELKRRQA